MNKNVKVSNPMKVITGLTLVGLTLTYGSLSQSMEVHLSTAYLLSSLSLTQRLLQRLRLQSKQPTRKVKASLKAMASPFLLFLSSKLRYVMETLKDLMMQLMPTHTSSTPTLHLHRVSQMQTAILSLLVLRFTLVSMVVPASASMLSTALVIRESPAVLTTYRRFVMVSLLVVKQVLSLISHLMKMTISLINGGADYGND